MAKRVFISHSSKDKPAVEKLAEALRAAGIDAWLDKWEIWLGHGRHGQLTLPRQARACIATRRRGPWGAILVAVDWPGAPS